MYVDRLTMSSTGRFHPNRDPKLEGVEKAAQVQYHARDILRLAQDHLELIPDRYSIGREDQLLFEVVPRELLEIAIPLGTE